MRRTGESALRAAGAVFILGLLAGVADAQVQARFASRSAIVGESIYYVIEVTLSGEDAEMEIRAPELPKGDGYAARYVDSRQSSSQEVQIFGGQFVRKVTVTTSLIYEVTAKAAGVLTIPSFECNVLGKDLRVPAAAIRVEREAPGNAYVDLVLSIDPPTPYVGQPAKITIELLFTKEWSEGRNGLSLVVPWFKSPEGFVGDEPEPAKERIRDHVPILINERHYNFKLDRVQHEGEEALRLSYARELTPVKAGQLLIDAISFQGDVVESYARNIFGEAVPRSTARVVKASKPLAVVVKEVPEKGRPASFTNAVGSLAAMLKAGPTEIKAGDPVTVTLSVSGKGNVEAIRPPALAGFEGFTCYEPEKKVEKDDARKGLPASRLTVTWLVIPKTSEVKEIPKVEFSWFDPAKDAFVTEAVGPLPLKITGTVADAPLVIGRSDERVKREIETRQVILANKPDFGAFRESGAGLFGPLFFVLIAIPLLSLAAATVFKRRRDEYSADAGLRRKAGAAKAARERLGEAERLVLGTGDLASSLAKVLTGFITDRLLLPPASVTSANIRELLSARDVDGSVVEAMEARLQDLDSRRFARLGDSAEERRLLLDAVASDLARLEKELR